jgi:hypothetical protein
MPCMTEISLDDIKTALVAGGISGPHQSHTRHNNLSNLRACVDGDPDKAFGISGLTLRSEQEAIDALSGLTGCSNDLGDPTGYDTIDPDLTVKGIVSASRRMRKEAERGATLLACTGHPTGVLELYIRMVDAFRTAGGKPVRLREEERFVRPGHKKEEEVRYIGGVGCLSDWGQLKHTHSPHAMELLLEEEPWPDLVLGDHGYAGAAIELDIPTIAIMDINDPALALAWAEERDVTIVPLDDNRPPRLYEPAWVLFEHVILGDQDD